MATRADIEQWIASQGGPGVVVHAYEDVEVPDPRGMRNLPDGSENPDYDRAFKDKKISTRRETWTNPTTKATFSVTRTPFANDQFEDVKQTPGTQTAAATGTSTSSPRVPVGSVPRIEGTPIPGQPGQFDNSQPIRAWHAPDGSIIYEALTPAERQQWEREKNGGRTDAEVARDTQEQATKPGTKIGERTEIKNGRRVTVERWRLPDGREEDRVKDEPEPAKPGQVIKGGGPNGEDVQAVQKPDGTVTYQPIQGAQVPSANRPIPANAPKYTPDPNDPNGTWGILAYNEQLREAARTGVITPQQAQQLIEEADKAAEVARNDAVTRQNQATTRRNQDLTQRAQDLGEVQSRRSFAGSGFDTLFGDFSGQARYLGKGGGDIAARAFMTALGAREQYPARTGGYADVPQVSPAVEAVRQGTQVHVSPSGNVSVSPPGAMPGEAVTPPAPPAAPGQASAGPPARDDWRTNPGAPLPLNPEPGQPGYDPRRIGTEPVGSLPAYLQQPAAAAPPPQWDSGPLVAKWRQQGLSDDEIQQALAESERMVAA